MAAQEHDERERASVDAEFARVSKMTALMRAEAEVRTAHKLTEPNSSAVKQNK